MLGSTASQPDNRYRQTDPKAVDGHVTPSTTSAGYECLMVFVGDREEKTEGRRDDEIPQTGSRIVFPEERIDEQEEDRELSGMPALDDGEPAIRARRRRTGENLRRP